MHIAATEERRAREKDRGRGAELLRECMVGAGTDGKLIGKIMGNPRTPGEVLENPVTLQNSSNDNDPSQNDSAIARFDA